MNHQAKAEDFGILIEPTTLKIERMLPGRIERVWSYVTYNDLRRQWFASVARQLQPDAPFELVWRDDAVSNTAGTTPEGKA